MERFYKDRRSCVYSSFIRNKIKLKTAIPIQGMRFVSMAIFKPAKSATIPMIHGITMAPIPPIGRRTPMLVLLMILPTPATATGLTPAMEKAKAKSIRIAAMGALAKIIRLYMMVQPIPMMVRDLKVFLTGKTNAIKSLAIRVAPHITVTV